MTTSAPDGAIPEPILGAFNQRTAAARAHYQAGGDVCGYYGNGMPVEIALATGHMPMAVMPLPDRQTPYADEWVNPTFVHQQRLIFDQLISGELDFTRIVVAISQASPDAWVYHYARELVRRGVGGAIPPLHLYSLLGLQHRSVTEYGRLQTEALARRLRANSGTEATPARLRAAIDLMNALRAQWRQLDAARRQGAISGVAAMKLLAASRFMDGKEYLAAAAVAIRRLKAGSLKGPRLLLVSAESLADTRLHQAAEAAGAVVVGEDDPWGAQVATPDIAAGDDPIGAIYRHYYTHTQNRSVYPAAVRLAWFYENVRAPEVDGVAIHMGPTDRVLGWDYPRMRDYLASVGKVHLMIRDDIYSGQGHADAKAALERFVAEIQEKAA